MANKYRVLAGSHVGPDIHGKVLEIRAGIDGHDVIETEQNLLELNGPRGFSPKFQLVNEEVLPTDRASLLREKERIEKQLAALGTAQTPAPPQPIDKMSEKELREYADDNEIDLAACKTRDAMVAAIKKAMA